jgi:diguanylate cyclase (GGDEF)-like protein/PAS domain S-box-containing protein
VPFDDEGRLRLETSADGLVGATMPDLFRLAMRQSAIAMCLVGLDGRFLAVNSATCQLLGRSSDELVRTTFQELTHPADLESDLAELARVVSGEQDSYQLTKRYLRPDGAIVHGSLSVSAVRSPVGDLIAYLSLIVDVSEREQARTDAALAREELRGVIDSLIDPWVYLEAIRDVDGRIVDFAFRDANDAALVANRMTRAELLGSTLLTLLPAHVEHGLFDRYVTVVETGEPLVLDDDPFASDLTDNERRWFDNRAVRVGDGLSFTWRDVTDRVRIRRRLAREARSDALTGLVNRVGLAEAARAMFERSPREGRRIGILYCDLDGLKTINDTYGHEWGDRVLRAVAERIAGTVRSGDIAARVGGDEFVVIADGILDDDAVVGLATKLADAVTQPVHHGAHTVTPTLSIGLALADRGEDVAAALRRADAALYERKRARGYPGRSQEPLA